MEARNNHYKEFSRKLNVIIALLSDIKESERQGTLKEKIAYFGKLSLSNREIAQILNISEKHVSKEKSLIKKKNG